MNPQFFCDGVEVPEPMFDYVEVPKFSKQAVEDEITKFWAEEKMVVDIDGDVVYFDITYRLYKDCQPF